MRIGINKRTSREEVRIILHRQALESIFDECDQYNRDETGGRLIGTFQMGGGLRTVTVRGVIDAGPKARRSSSSFFQDGAYQADIFTQVERLRPDIEHLGNWHTHHVNGFPTLSGGDIETYRRIVNHELHNTDFFYALLVVAKNLDRTGLDRYDIKHFVIYRDEPTVHEISPTSVRIVNRSIVWPRESETPILTEPDAPLKRPQPVRVKDQEVFREQYPALKPHISGEQRMYWRGRIELVNSSTVDVVIVEMELRDSVVYSIAAKGKEVSFLPGFSEMTFPSARRAIWDYEKALNREIFLSHTKRGRKRKETL